MPVATAQVRGPVALLCSLLGALSEFTTTCSLHDFALDGTVHLDCYTAEVQAPSDWFENDDPPRAPGLSKVLTAQHVCVFVSDALVCAADLTDGTTGAINANTSVPTQAI